MVSLAGTRVISFLSLALSQVVCSNKERLHLEKGEL